MKVFLIIFLVLDLLLIGGAVIRFTTATPETQPIVDFMNTGGDFSSSNSARHSTTGGGLRAGDQEADAFMSAVDPNAGKDMSIETQLGTASQIEDNRQQDLDGAKERIGQIGK